MNYREILKQIWGYDSFRPLQEEIIQSIAAGRDTLALMPTGGGKSITFQVPTLAEEGLCLVVTPLIALMKDQVDNLKRRRVKATAIYSGMGAEEMRNAMNNCLYGNYRFLYVSPERLSTRFFLDYAPRLRVTLIAVDEAHCISQWGYDFRPAYLNIATIRPLFPAVPILALTATATEQVVADIQDKLLFKQHNVLKKSFVRSNLAYVARKTTNKSVEMIHILNRVKGTAIVYVRSREKTKKLAGELVHTGISAAYYHAGLTRKEKEQRQTAWSRGECRVIVSTNAFGMGIDKEDVRCVIHYDAPDSLEEYFQEAGRAGRDEQKAYAVFLYGEQDERQLRYRVSNRFPSREYIRNVYEKLGSFFQLAVLSGKDRTFQFSINRFCATYRLSINQVNNALTLLTQAGYIDYIEDPDGRSRVMFTIRRDDLYLLREQSAETERTMQAILRNYTGLFADYAYIDEEFVAMIANIDRQRLYETLVRLDKQKIINYIPQNSSPLIVYTRQREEARTVAIPRSIFEERQELYGRRIEAVISYLNNSSVCRTQQLIEYFGEKSDERCGVCDVCLSHKKNRTAEDEFETIRQAVETCLNERPYTIKELADTITQFPPQRMIEVVRYLLDELHFRMSDDGCISKA